MRRDLAKYFGVYQGIKTDAVNYFEPVDSLLQESDLKPLLDEIFAVDSRSGMPKGDIQYFLSKDGNPQVKAFIESQLFAKRQVEPQYDPAQFSDDLLYEFKRQDNETVAQYAKRIDDLRMQAIADYDKFNDELKKQKID